MSAEQGPASGGHRWAGQTTWAATFYGIAPRRELVRLADAQRRRLEAEYAGPSILFEPDYVRSHHRNLEALSLIGLYHESRLARWRRDREPWPNAWLDEHIAAIDRAIRARRERSA